MFSKFRSNSTISAHHQSQNGGGYESNPISQHFEIGKAFASAGPELIWKIHGAFRKSDGKECSVFIFEKRIAEKLHKPKRKEIVTEVLRNSVKQLERFRHPRILHVLHTVEECADTLAFATEPVLASLENIFAYQQETLINNSSQTNNSPAFVSTFKVPFSVEYHFLDIEIKYGLLQITEALSFLHYNGHIIHRNVCPASVLVNKKGTWKLSGFEFTCNAIDSDGIEPVPCQAWASRISKMIQPSLDYIAPEIQISCCCSILSDMFSLGMLICAVFNHGKPLIQSNYTTSTYLKQIETLDAQIEAILARIPIPLQEATVRMLSKDIRQRPTSQLLSLLKYFSDSTVNALQFLDVINMKDPTQKENFYRKTLKDALPLIPKKLWFQHIWPCLQQEIHLHEVLAAVLQPVIFLVQECTIDEYENVLLPAFKVIFSMPKSVQAMVEILENLHIIMEKSPCDEIRTEVLPLLYSSLDSSMIQIQNAALVAMANVSEYIDQTSAQRIVLPKIQTLYTKNMTDLKIVSSILISLQSILDKLSKPQVDDDVLPLIWDIRLIDGKIIVGVVVNLIANRIMPSLVAQTVNPSLNLEQFSFLIKVLQEMLDQIDKSQRNKLKLDSISISSLEYPQTSLRHQHSTENLNVPPFCIPNLRIDRRKTSSAENMTRKNSTGGLLGSWWFNQSPSTLDRNFLRVLNAFPNRRLSDNTLMTPKIRVATSCTSSIGDSPGGSGSSFPLRRHSSIGPQERRGSTVNLSPPPGFLGFRSLSRKSSSASMPSSNGGSMPNTSCSVPFLFNGSAQSFRSQRTSANSSHQSSAHCLPQVGWGGGNSGRMSSSTQQIGTKQTTVGQPVRKCPSLNIQSTY